MNQLCVKIIYNFIPDLDEYHRKNILDFLLSLPDDGKEYANVELRDEILTLTMAAIDTSAVTIGTTLKLLAKYPKIQEKVYDE